MVLSVFASCSLLDGCGGAGAPPQVANGQAIPTQGAAAPSAPAALKPTSPESAGKRAATEVTVFHLHKILRKIGIERDTFTPSPDGSMEIKASFGFQDRGTEVPLAAVFRLDRSGDLRSYAAWGSTSRISAIDDRVELDADGSYVAQRLGQVPLRVKPRPPFAVASSYAPMLAQDLMLRKWVESGRPATMTLVPEGTLTIDSRGKESYPVEGKTVELEHVSVRGLAWGRQDAWIDAAGKLAAVVTRDAELDHFEAVREGLVAILPALMTSAAADGVKWLAEVGKSAEKTQTGAIALMGADLVDGTGRAPIKDAVVVYEGNKIVAAGPRAKVAVPAGATKVDVSGKTIVPGLWDMHAHFQQVEHGAAYLAAGVTTVRDMGNILEFATGVRDAIDGGMGLGPRILVDGLIDGEGARTIGTIIVKSAADIVPVLDRLKRAGCLEVKIYSRIDPQLVKPIAVEAHRRGMRVVGHVPDGMDVVAALEAGFDGVSHVPFLFDLLFQPGEKAKISRGAMRRRMGDARFEDPKLSAVIRAFVAKKAFLDDTLALYELLNCTEEECMKREPGLSKVPRELRGMVDDVRPEEVADRNAMFERFVALVGELHRRGVPIVAGTDIAVPGHSLHRELELYVKAGFTPMEAIQAATVVPARMMHLDKESGTIEPGKRADLVVLDRNLFTEPAAEIAQAEVDLTLVDGAVVHARPGT